MFLNMKQVFTNTSTVVYNLQDQQLYGFKISGPASFLLIPTVCIQDTYNHPTQLCFYTTRYGTTQQIPLMHCKNKWVVLTAELLP